MGNPPSPAAHYVYSEGRPRGCLAETGGADVYTGKGKSTVGRLTGALGGAFPPHLFPGMGLSPHRVGALYR